MRVKKNMKDSEIIQEINQRIKELDYPGTSLNNGVYPLFNGDEVLGIYYPEKSCVLFYSEKLIKNIYTYEQAKQLIKK